MNLKEAPLAGWVVGDPGRAAVEVGAGMPLGHAVGPDIAVDSATVAALEVRAASVRGLFHRRFGTPRQDGYSLVWQEESDALIVTVCDGLGSLNLSHEAAELTVRRLSAVLHRDADSGQLRWADALAVVSSEIADLAEVRGDDMATTVMCAYVTQTGVGTYRAELAWIGDSTAYVLSSDGWEIVGGSVKSVDVDDGPSTSVTSALPSKSIDVHTHSVEFGSGSALFLMSDGVSDALGAGRGEVGEALGSWWALPPDPLTFAAQTGFARKSFDDDRTVVGVWTLGKDEVH